MIAWRTWTWRRTSAGGRWLGWSPIGVVLLASLLGLIPVMWWIGPRALLGLVIALPWDRVVVDAAGVSLVRGLGPIPWRWRRFPAGGTFIINDVLDGADDPREVAYSIDGDEHVLLSCAQAEQVRALLADAAGRGA